MVDDRHQLGFSRASLVEDLRKIRVQQLKINKGRQIRHQINLRARFLEKSGQRACLGFLIRLITARSQLVCNRATTFPLTWIPRPPELRIRPPIPVFRMFSGDLDQRLPQPRMSLLITSSLLSIGPSPCEKPQGGQDPVQPIFVIERPRQLNFFPRGELPAKKSFSSAISASL